MIKESNVSLKGLPILYYLSKIIKFILLITLSLIIITFSFEESFTRHLSLIAIPLFLLLMCSEKRAFLSSFPLRKSFGIFVVTFFIPLFFSTDFYFSQKFFFSCFISYIFLFLITWEVIDTPGKFKLMIFFVLVSLGIVYLDCIYQLLYEKEFFRGYSLHFHESAYINSALSGPFGYYNQLGEFLGATLLGLLFCSILIKGKKKIFYIIGWIIIFPALILSYSRGSWVSFLAGSIILIFIFIPKKVAFKLVFLAILLSFLGGFYLLIIHFFPEIENRMRLLLQLDSAGRIIIWKDTLKIFLQHPLFGVGINRLPHFTQGGFDAHNLWLKILAETGVIGGGGFMIFMVSYWIVIFKRIRHLILLKSHYLGYVFFFLSITLFVYLHNLVDVSIIDGWDLGIFFWICSGILLRGCFLKDEK